MYSPKAQAVESQRGVRSLVQSFPSRRTQASYLISPGLIGEKYLLYKIVEDSKNGMWTVTRASPGSTYCFFPTHCSCSFTCSLLLLRYSPPNLPLPISGLILITREKEEFTAEVVWTREGGPYQGGSLFSVGKVRPYAAPLVGGLGHLSPRYVEMLLLPGFLLPGGVSQGPGVALTKTIAHAAGEVTFPQGKQNWDGSSQDHRQGLLQNCLLEWGLPEVKTLPCACT